MCAWLNLESCDSISRRLQLALRAQLVWGDSPVINYAIAQLEEYFEGCRQTFDLPLLHVGSDFQRYVWSELIKIPYGQTISYKELACRIGNPKACRAVASANRSNPVSIIVPCHRVVGANGALTGYAGCAGGLVVKDFLIKLEQVLFQF